MEIRHLSKFIHGKQILSGIDFTVKTGNIIGIVGRNGAGKTTLLRTMVGILDPAEGDVLIDGKSIFSHPQVKEQIIFVPDSSEALKNYSTREILFLYKSIYPKFDEDYFHELMARFSLKPVNKIGNYSKGMKALFSLVVAFSTRAKYILLDEPTDGLDVIVKKRILKILVEEVASYDVSVIISSHRLDELEFMANAIIMIKDGKVDTHYELDEMKKLYKKVQLVFTGGIPEELASRLKVLSRTGSVYTVMVEKDDDTLHNELEAASPLLFEQLPLSLEDLFVAQLGGEENEV